MNTFSDGLFIGFMLGMLQGAINLWCCILARSAEKKP